MDSWLSLGGGGVMPSRLIIVWVVHVAIFLIASLLLCSIPVLPMTFDPAVHILSPDDVT
jgi:hypothetical protein